MVDDYLINGKQITGYCWWTPLSLKYKNITNISHFTEVNVNDISSVPGPYAIPLVATESPPIKSHYSFHTF